MGKEKLVWTEDLSVDDEGIDGQHQYLFSLTNELADEKAASDPYEFVRLLSSLTDYSRTHFSQEEDYMALYGYPELKKHRAEHMKFIYQVSMFNAEYRTSIPTDAATVFLFLKSWLINHILKMDMEYRNFIAKK
jgi:hemerythrin-like metal-binding protein